MRLTALDARRLRRAARVQTAGTSAATLFIPFLRSGDQRRRQKLRYAGIAEKLLGEHARMAPKSLAFHAQSNRIPPRTRPMAQSFATFWPEYLRAHSRPATRVAHLVGTLLGWALLIAAIALRRWWWILAAPAVSYALAWISHFTLERNRPATFEHPLWSWVADQKMVALMLTGRMSAEVTRHATPARSAKRGAS